MHEVTGMKYRDIYTDGKDMVNQPLACANTNPRTLKSYAACEI